MKSCEIFFRDCLKPKYTGEALKVLVGAFVGFLFGMLAYEPKSNVNLVGFLKLGALILLIFIVNIILNCIKERNTLLNDSYNEGKLYKEKYHREWKKVEVLKSDLRKREEQLTTCKLMLLFIDESEIKNAKIKIEEKNNTVEGVLKKQEVKDESKG